MVNSKGASCKALYPGVRRAGGGSIVNICSVAGFGQQQHKNPLTPQGAVRFAKVIATQHAKDNIRSNAIFLVLSIQK